jgi:alpha-ribazole phosphatase
MTWELPDGTTRFILVRHGEPEPSAAGRCYGRLDVALSERGLQQAVETASWLRSAPITAVYSSPSRRALETARPIAAAHALAVCAREELQEIDFGAFEGLTYEEAAARHPEIYSRWMSDPAGVTFPDGESLRDLATRVLRIASELRERHRGGAVLIVAHAGVLRTLLGDALNMNAGDLFRIDVACAGVSVIDHLDGARLVRLMNGRP